jgi:hypothetical protein
MSKKKKKKEKIIYYDDYSTISDMSGVGRARPPKQGSQKESRQTPQTVYKPSKWKTYWSSVRMMLVPCLIALGVLGGLYLIIMLASGNLF